MRKRSPADDVREKPLRRRDRKKSEEALLAAGIEAFAEHGFDAATTRDIASRAGLNEQLITRYFGGKSGLLVAAYEDFLKRQENIQAYADAPPKANAHQEIESFLLAKHARYRDTEKLVMIFVPRLLIDPDTRASIDKALLEKATRILAERLLALQHAGQIHTHVDIEQLSHSIAYQSLGVSFMSRLIRGISDDEAIAQLRQFAVAIAYGVSTADHG